MSGSTQHSLKRLSQASARLRLSPFERKLFEFLKDVVTQEQLDLTLRVAGGWVRDKLLGHESDDIDIALDKSLGSDFAQRAASRFYGSKVPSEPGALEPHTHLIAANPDQSKHLETARVKLFDVWVDFVNLRAEEYADHSRIPTMRFGTPLEDALRRDLTINSLFYNIHTDEVEDFTGHGLADLQELRLIRTPLPPLVTLLDDPLRALRAVRFGARMGYDYDGQLVAAAQSAEVRQALLTKVSRERYGKELHGILRTAKDAVDALAELNRWQLLEVVFRPPDTEQAVEAGGAGAADGVTDLNVARAYERVLQLRNSGGGDAGAGGAAAAAVQSSPDWTAPATRAGLFAALLWPVRNVMGVPGRSKKRRREPLAQSIVVALQFKDGQDVSVVQQGAAAFTDEAAAAAAAAGAGAPSDKERRATVGLVIRQTGALWATAVDVAEAVAESSGDSATADAVRALRRWIGAQSLGTAWQLKALLNGHQLMQRLGVPRGPILSQLDKAQVQWQLSHPAGTAEQVEQFLRTHPLLVNK